MFVVVIVCCVCFLLLLLFVVVIVCWCYFLLWLLFVVFIVCWCYFLLLVLFVAVIAVVQVAAAKMSKEENEARLFDGKGQGKGINFDR